MIHRLILSAMLATSAIAGEMDFGAGGATSGSSSGDITPTSVTTQKVTINGTDTKCFSADDPTIVVDCSTHKVSIGGTGGLLVSTITTSGQSLIISTGTSGLAAKDGRYIYMTRFGQLRIADSLNDFPTASTGIITAVGQNGNLNLATVQTVGVGGNQNALDTAYIIENSSGTQTFTVGRVKNGPVGSVIFDMRASSGTWAHPKAFDVAVNNDIFAQLRMTSHTDLEQGLSLLNLVYRADGPWQTNAALGTLSFPMKLEISQAKQIGGGALNTFFSFSSSGTLHIGGVTPAGNPTDVGSLVDTAGASLVTAMAVVAGSRAGGSTIAGMVVGVSTGAGSNSFAALDSSGNTSLLVNSNGSIFATAQATFSYTGAGAVVIGTTTNGGAEALYISSPNRAPITTRRDAAAAVAGVRMMNGDPTNGAGAVLQFAACDSNYTACNRPYAIVTGVTTQHNAASVSGDIFLSAISSNSAINMLYVRSSGTVEIIGSYQTPSGYVLNASSTTGVQASIWGVTTGGHVVSSGTTPSIACNAGAPVMLPDSNDMSGEFTGGVASANCTVTFVNAFSKKPRCWCQDGTSIIALKAVTTTSTLVCTSATTIGTDAVMYGCQAAP